MGTEKQLKEYKVGEHDIHGKIIDKIFYTTDEYLIYKRKNERNICYLTNGDHISSSLIEPELAKLKAKTTLRNLIRLNSNIARAYKLCFEGKVEEAKDIIEKLIKRQRKRKSRLIKAHYLLGSLIFLILIVLTAIICYSYFDQSKEIYKQILTIISFGGVGGFLSITFRINRIKLNTRDGIGLTIISGTFRIIYSMIASFVMFWAIKANIVFGFLNKLTNNIEVIYFLAIASGFSESLVPNLITEFEKKFQDESKDKNFEPSKET